MTAATNDTNLRDWHELSSKTQLELRIEFGHHLDSMPPTCALDLKMEYFRSWLLDQGIHYQIRQPPRNLSSASI